MLDNVSTAPYPPGQIDPAELVATEAELVGLGLLPMALIAAGQQTGALDAAGNFFGNLFGGDTPDHDVQQVQQWAADLAAGRIGPAAGGFDTAEVQAAVGSAPRGRPGDDPGTVEGLRTALTQPMPELAPYVRTDTALSRVAVGVAHGRLDGVVGWQEEPAVVHLEQLVADYRSRPPSSSMFGAPIFGAPSSSSGAPAIASIAGTPRFAIAALGAAAVAAYLLMQKR